MTHENDVAHPIIRKYMTRRCRDVEDEVSKSLGVLLYSRANKLNAEENNTDAIKEQSQGP